MQNTIERSIDITAPLERIWDLVTEPGWWVPSDTPVDLDRTAGAVVVRESAEHGRYPVQVVEVRPMTYVAFRWASSFPGAELIEGHTTLIEFTVTPTAEGARVSVVESGFAELDGSDELKAKGFGSNSDGWTEMIVSLRDRAEARVER